MALVKEILRGSELFGNLTEEELNMVARLGRHEVYEAGEIVFTEERAAKDLYVVEEGRVALEVKLRFGSHSQRQATISVLKKGHGLGWSAIDRSSVLTSTARCLERTRVVAIDGVGLEHLFRENPWMGYQVMLRVLDMLRYRLDHTRDTLAHVLSIASHDLKAPLAAVESYLQVMKGGFAGETTEKQRNMLTRCSERISGLINLIDDILDISRLDTGERKLEPTSLLSVAENSVENIRPQAAKKGMELVCDLPEQLTE
ncbi:MAG: histidine kinase dimerization/phospho-acceptor domain-containing protein, partial [Chloroflexota bacterium]